MALSMGKVAPDCCHETEDLGVGRDESGHATGMSANGEVHEAAVKDAELRIKRERGVDVLQCLVRRWCVGWQNAIKVGAIVGKRLGQ